MATKDARVVIVGSGPGGATFADAVTAVGWDCIVLEKGRNHLLDLEPPYALKGEYSNDELKFVYRHFLGPDPLIEPRTYRRDENDGDHLTVGEANNLPSTVGGGGVHADGKLPRFREIDFRLKSEMGPIDGATIEDWPITYADLEPYYAAVERGIGVAGEVGTNPFAAWRSSGYPMPPGPDMFGALLSTEAAERRGLHPYRAPSGVNSVPYDGRPACVNCGFCGPFGCPVHAKGDPVAMLRRAMQSGRCQIRPESYVTSVLVEGSDSVGGARATGVAYLDADGQSHEVHADYVVLAGGAFETPRLLLQCGVANSSGQVGRNLTYHFQTLTVGGFPFDLHGERGRDVTHLHDDHIVPTKDDLAAARAAGLPYFRGGIVEHGSSGHPVMEAKTYPSGAMHNEAMRSSGIRAHMWVFTMQGEDLPQATNRVDLDPTVRDVFGLPAGRVTYRPHRHEVVASDHFSTILESVMIDAGAQWSFSTTSPPVGEITALDRANPLGLAPASRHVMGTCRMGHDPRTSVVNHESRFHDVDNLLCADSSVFVTSAGYGPTLTLAALSLRAACLLTGTPLAPTTRPPPHPPARRQ